MKKRELKLSEIESLMSGLSLIKEAKVTFVAKRGYDVAMTAMNCESHIKALQEQKDSCLMKYGKEESKDSGRFILSGEENIKSYSKEMSALLDKKVKVEMFEGDITLDELGEAQLPLDFHVIFNKFLKS